MYSSAIYLVQVVQTPDSNQMGPRQMPTLTGSTMAKKQAPKSVRDDVAVKIDRGLIEKAKYVVARKRTTLAAYLTEIVRGTIDKDFARAIKDAEGPSK